MSLVRTGVAAFSLKGAFKGKATTNAGNLKGMNRLALLSELIPTLVGSPSLVVIEGYSFASAHNLPVLGELGGIVKLALYKAGIPFIIVPPSTLKKFVTSNHVAKKDEVMLHVYKRWGVECSVSDEADAVGLAAFGAAYLGALPGLTAFQQEVLQKYRQKHPAGV